ncbi:MAG: hypothetical protein KGL97_06840 [Alphaproteobacteria bacterium]|nr:hypothetical protein [Alphaproteobacteria bacterium]
MRVPILALVVVLAAGLAVGAVAAPASHPPQANAVAASPVPPAAPPTLAGDFKKLTNTYRSHRQDFERVSEYSERVRSNWVPGLLAFAVFILLTLPFNTRGARAFYRQMMEASPLSAEDGATEENNRQARKVLFFYLLFLLYQLAEYPLTLGHGGRIQFITDLVIQTVLVAAIAWAFHRLKRDMHEQWKSDPERQEKVDRWLNQKLEGMRVRWRDIRKLAFGVFIAGFAPSVLAHLTGWLDALTDFGQRIFGS